MQQTMTTAQAWVFTDPRQIGRYMALKYNAEQHREYLNMLDKAARRWLKVFDHNTVFYSAVYWDLLTRLWKAGKPIRRTDALRFMTSIKSASTAGKYIDEAIRQEFLCETTNPQDARSKLLELSPEMRDRLDAYFDDAINELQQTNTTISQHGAAPGTSSAQPRREQRRT
jgi:hypothetical protein